MKKLNVKGLLILSILILTVNMTFGQKNNFNIEFGPSISFFSRNLITLNYSFPVNSATGYSYNELENTYKRIGNIGYGLNIATTLNYQLDDRFFLIYGLSVEYLANKITTSLLSSHNFKTSSNPQSQLSLGENINGYFPAGYDVAIDENGILVAAIESEYNNYKIIESLKSTYISIPIKIGLLLNERTQLAFGIINSILLSSNISTTYPYIEDRIIENNISSFNKYVFSIQGSFSYNIAKNLRFLISYQRSLSNMVNMNDIYDVKNGDKINILNINLKYIINRKE